MLNDEAVAQVVEFTASVTVLVLLLTAFYTALGYQASYYTTTEPRPVRKAVNTADILMAETGHVSSPDTTHWEYLSEEDLSNLTSFGLSTGEFGVLSFSKIIRLRTLNVENHTDFYDRVKILLGLSYFNPETGIYSSLYGINITIYWQNGTEIVAWGQNGSINDVRNSHTVVERIVLIKTPDRLERAYMRIDLIH